MRKILSRTSGCAGSRSIASVIANPAAYLATATTRLCINATTSARARRETYVGPWLPEPVDASVDTHLGPERDQSLRLAILVLLEKLSPTERAAYVLREAFDYPYSQIAEILRMEEANARQLVTRARKHVSEGRRASDRFERTATIAGRFPGCRAKRRHGRAGRAIHGGCRLRCRWRRAGPRGSDSGFWPRACSEVYRLRFRISGRA